MSKKKKLKHCFGYTTQTVVLSAPSIFVKQAVKISHPCCLVRGHKAHHKAVIDGQHKGKYQTVSLYWLS